MPLDRMTCLVTGGAGFIGSHVVTRLIGEGATVRVIDNLSTGARENLAHVEGRFDFLIDDLRDPDACARAVDGVEVVFHLAALPSVPRSIADPWASHDANVNGTMRLLDACRRAHVRRVINSSSSSVYGDTPVLPKHEAAEPLPRSPYAVSKLASEQYVLAFARAGVMEGVALRYFNIFGPRQSAASQYAAVIPKFLEAARDGTPVTVNGDGGQTRDFTYVDNAVEANLLAATADASRASGVVVNVGAGDRTSLLELIAKVEEVAGCRLEREFLPPRAGDVRDSLASLARAREAIGYQPVVSLGDGLRRTWEWWLASNVSVTVRT